jgi:murein DD-endopeptidase MepM/ murein hydrolase activator NlpD
MKSFQKCTTIIISAKLFFHRIKSKKAAWKTYLIFIAVLSAHIALGLALTYFIHFFSAGHTPGHQNRGEHAHSAYAVYVQDRELGLVEDLNSFYIALDDYTREYPWIKEDTFFRDLIQFKSTNIEDKTVLSGSIKRGLEEYLERFCKGWYITADGRRLVALSSRENAERVVDTVVSQFTPRAETEEEIRSLKVRTEEKVGFAPAIVLKEKLVSPTDALHYIVNGTYEKKTYTIVPGDTIWDISRKYGLSIEEIKKANPEVHPEKIYPGDEINLIVPKPFITVHADYTHVYTRSIPFRTYIIWDNSLYRNQYVYKRRGKAGTEEVTARISMKNGIVEKKEIVKTQKLSTPRAALLRRGTRRTPDDVLVSSAILPPGEGLISSPFGPRWGGFHFGIDIAVPTGTTVYAFRPGKVLSAHYSGRLGNLLVIEHENGILTKYGHLKTMLVHEGDTVTGSQNIALSGNSGYSTGPHVHFEIHRAGRPVDPLEYLKSIDFSVAE